jgi:hypothetical protein
MPKQEAEKADETQDDVKPARRQQEAEKADGLVEMRKGDEVLRVDPSTLKAHTKAGWEAV